MGGKGSGGARRNAGRPKSVIAFLERRYRVPRQYAQECSDEIKQVLKKYRDLCKK